MSSAPSAPTRARLLHLALAVVALISGCDGGTGPVPVPKTPFVASVVGGTPETPPQVFVSLPSDSIPNGTRAVIHVARTGATAVADMLEGGFDPVALDAIAGDRVTVTVTMSDGSTPVIYEVVVPKVTRPVVVRTSPGKQKRDVPLNASMLVVLSEPIDPNSLGDGGIRLRRGSTFVSGDAEFADAARTTIRFTPDAPLVAGTDYELVVAASLRDAQGMTLDADVTVPFRTAVPSLTFKIEPNISVITGQYSTIRVLTQVIARYASGEIATHFTGAVTVALEDVSRGILEGTTTVNAVEGIATFLDLRTDIVGSGHRLIATAAGYDPAMSAEFEAGGSSHPFQDEYAINYRGLPLDTVYVRIMKQGDISAPNFNGMVTLSLVSGTSGVLSGTTTVRAVNGYARFPDLQVTGAESFQFVATIPGVLGLHSQTIQPQPLGLRFSSPPTTRLQADGLGTVTVTAGADWGAVAQMFNGDITLALGQNPGGGTLTGTRTVRAINGVATFTDLSISAPGNGYTLVATTACCNVAPVTSPAFDVALSSFAFIAQPTNTTAVAAFSPAVQVAARNVAGEIVSSYNGPITITLGSSQPGARLIGTATVNAVNGVATFSDLSVDAGGTGYTLVARGPEYAPATSASFAITSPWAVMAPMPTPRIGFATAVVDGKLHVVGGRTSQSALTGVVEVYDPATNTWTTRAPMPTPRAFLAANVANGILYAAGGIDGSNMESRTFESYDPATNSWTSRANLLSERAGFSVGSLDGKLYAIGTSWLMGGPGNQFDVYDPATNGWTSMGPMPTHRGFAGVTSLNGLLYVVGGEYMDNDPDVGIRTEVFDPRTGLWSRRADMIQHRIGAGVVAGNNRIYAIGGYNFEVLRRTSVDAFDPATNRWIAQPAIPRTRHTIAAAFIDGTVYVVTSTPASFASVGPEGTETFAWRP